MERVVLTSHQKALRINLDTNIYGTFAEIGAGQEVVRHFFRAGGASGTIAKTMSAYDKDVSDAIYGKEPHGRYVCESRLRRMIEHEYDLLEQRLERNNYADRKYFSFADTVATINFSKTIQGHGWMGIRFQSTPDKGPNDIVIHIRLHDQDAPLQQETIGIVGANLLYGSFFYYNNPRELLKSLYDNLSRDRLEIDMIQFTGPDYDELDNRLMSLQLVKYGMTDAVIFSPDGRNLQAADLLYKKNILAIRGSFRPVTKVNIDMIKNGFDKFITENKVEEERVQVLFEITLSNLLAGGDLDERDFIDRADILCSLGQTVLISNYKEYYKLINYFSQHTRRRMGLIMGVNSLIEVFNEKYYRDLNGGVLEAFGILFTRDLKIYLYPASEDDVFYNSKNVRIHPRLKPIYDYLLFNKRIVDLENYKPEVLNVHSVDVLKKIKNGKSGWENDVPTYVDVIIKENGLFGYEKEEELLEE